MKTYFLGLALAAFVSAVAIQGLHARTTTPPVFVVVEIDEITDADGFEALRQAADATAIEVQFEDGRYFARTENVTALDGSAPKFFTFISRGLLPVGAMRGRFVATTRQGLSTLLHASAHDYVHPPLRILGCIRQVWS